MPDLEKVIYALEQCSNVQSDFTSAVYVCPVCLYGKEDGMPCESLHPLLEDAIALLKAQQKHVDDLHHGIIALRDAMKGETKNG